MGVEMFVRLRILAVLLLPLLAAGCVTATNTETNAAAPPGGNVAFHLLPCTDRTGTQGRDLGAEATKALQSRLAAAGLRVEDAGNYDIACDVTGFNEGSAVKRWLMPGWGATVGQVAVMVTDRRTGQIAITVRGNATVGSGGLYTIGADTYILDAAINDVVKQLRDWAGVKPATASALPPRSQPT
jgi:hypothetical protein